MTPEQDNICASFADAMAKAGIDTPAKVAGFVTAAAAYVGRMQVSYAKDAARIKADALRTQADQIENEANVALAAADKRLATAAV